MTARSAGVLLVLAAMCVTSGCFASRAPQQEHEAALAAADALAAEWLGALTGASDEQRGYSSLHPTVREGLPLEDYLEAVGGPPGDAPSWEILPQTDREASSVGAWYQVFARLEGGSSSLPMGLQDLRLIQPHTLDHADIGVVIVVKADQLGTGIWQP